MKYLLVYYGGSAGATPEEQQKAMEEWGKWFGTLGPALADGGAPFSGKVNTISPAGSVSDGPKGEGASGYSILEADSLDAAVGMVKGCPLLSTGGTISVYETYEM